jgi:hypothetical protein
MGREREQVRKELNKFLTGRQTMPTHREFDAAGLSWLYQELITRGGLSYWAREMRLPLKRKQRKVAPSLKKSALDDQSSLMRHETAPLIKSQPKAKEKAPSQHSAASLIKSQPSNPSLIKQSQSAQSKSSSLIKSAPDGGVPLAKKEHHQPAFKAPTRAPISRASKPKRQATKLSKGITQRRSVFD